MLEAVLVHRADEPEAGYTEDHTAERLSVEAVKDAWEASRSPTAGSSSRCPWRRVRRAHRGSSDAEQQGRRHRAVSRVGYTLARVIEAVGARPSRMRPAHTLEPIMAMLAELYPADFEVNHGPSCLRSAV